MDPETVQLEVVDLDSLSPKQLAKEYKAALKLIKSKEQQNRMNALEKFKDFRYLIEGGCLITFIDSITPKKKSMDYTKVAIDFFASFLLSPSKFKDESVVLAAVKAIVAAEGNLNILNVLVLLTVFKEEVKVKSKQSTDRVSNEDLITHLHFAATKILYVISEQIVHDKTLMKHFVSIPNILQTLSEALKGLSIIFQDELVRGKMIEEGIWVLCCIVRILKNTENIIPSFLRLQILDIIISFSNEPNFTLYCLQIFELISVDTSSSDSLATVSDISLMNHLLSLLRVTTTKLGHVDSGVKDISRPPTAPAKDTKKGSFIKGSSKQAKDASKDEAPVAAAPKAVEIKTYSKANPTRLLVSYAQILVNIFTTVAKHPNFYVAFDEEISAEVVELCKTFMLEKDIWTLCNQPIADPVDVPIQSLILDVSILFGCLGKASTSARKSACNAGAVPTLISLLHRSRAVYGLQLLAEPPDMSITSLTAAAPAPTSKGGKGDKPAVPSKDSKTTPRSARDGDTPSTVDDSVSINKATSLRAVCEKAVMHLWAFAEEVEVGQTACRESKVAVDLSETKFGSIRWDSCELFVTDKDLFYSSLDSESQQRSPAVFMTHVIDLVASVDADLSDCGVRLLASILEGVEADFEVFLNESKVMDVLPLLVTKLSTVLERCGTIYVSSISKVMALFTSVLADDNQSLTSQQSLVPPLAMDANENANKYGEILTSSLLSLSKLLPLTEAGVSVFATENNLSIFGTLLYECGPIGSFSSTSKDKKVSELTIILSDPRTSSWRPSERSTDDITPNSIVLRALILDVLSTVILADGKYRKYDADVPPPPGEKFPESSSSCQIASNLAIKLCADAVFSIVATESSYEFGPDKSRITTYPVPAAALAAGERGVLSGVVLDAALATLEAISTSGIRGLASMYGSIASPVLLQGGDAEKGRRGSLAGLKDFLYAVNLSELEPTSESNDSEPTGKDILSSSFEWKFPILFDTLAPCPSLISTPKILLETPDLWPFVVVSGAFLGVLSNPAIPHSSLVLALNGLTKVCNLDLFPVVSQPAVADLLCATFLSMGGGVTLSGLLGRFGPLFGYVGGQELLTYLLSRGSARQTFWDDWAEKARQRDAADPNKGKGKKPAETKKTDKNKKTADEDTGLTVPYEPDEMNADPNHGPNRTTWSSLLNVSNNDLHSKANGSLCMTTCLVSGLQATALQLIEEGADANISDGYDMTALMYALLFGEEEVLAALLKAGSDPDQLHKNGSPTIKFAFFTITSESLPGLTSGGVNERVVVTGSTTLLSRMLAAGSDTRVSDSAGLYPVHYAVGGLESIDVVLGGYKIQINNSAYKTDSQAYVLDVLQLLVAHEADVNVCTKLGLTPLHIAASRNDLAVAKYILSRPGSTLAANTLDSSGFLPVHYSLSSAFRVDQAIDVIKLLLDSGNGRRIVSAIYSDDRTGKSKRTKYLLEVEAVLEETLRTTLQPDCVLSKRALVKDLLSLKLGSNLNCLLLLLAGKYFQETFSSGVYKSDPSLLKDKSNHPTASLQVCEYLLSLLEKEGCLQPYLSATSSHGMSVLHALILFMDVPTTESEVYGGLWQRLVLRQGNISGNEVDREVAWDGVCSFPIPSLGLPPTWTPLHAAIAKNNKQVVDSLLMFDVDLTQFPYLHYLTLFDTDVEILQILITAASDSTAFQSLLNDEDYPYEGFLGLKALSIGTPLHLAVRFRRAKMIACLMTVKKINPNSTSTDTGASPFLEACATGDMELINAFAVDSDRIDLLLTDFNGDNSIDIVLASKDHLLLQKLITMRRNDVVGYVIKTFDDAYPSILKQLELDNMRLVEAAGIRQVAAAIPNLDEFSPADEATQRVIRAKDEDLLTDDGSGVVPCNALATDAVEVEAVKLELEVSDRILSLLLAAVMDAGISEPAIHAHICFSEGILYRSLL